MFDDSAAMIGFLNVAVDPTIILNQPENTERLRTLLRELRELRTLLHTNATLVIAMEALNSYDFSYMRRKFQSW